jgi:type IV pilus biogenesis protein CpaD/CtpE
MKGEADVNIKTILMTAAVAGVAACSGSMTKPTATEADFGNSHASLVRAQTQNPGTLTNPSAQAPTGVDPDYANNVLKTMRETVSKPSDVKKPIEIKVDGGT